jgi:hypothetical protein
VPPEVLTLVRARFGKLMPERLAGAQAAAARL